MRKLPDPPKPDPNRWLALKPPYPSNVKSLVEANNQVSNRVASVKIEKETGRVMLVFGNGKRYISSESVGLSE